VINFLPKFVSSKIAFRNMFQMCFLRSCESWNCWLAIVSIG